MLAVQWSLGVKGLKKTDRKEISIDDLMSTGQHILVIFD
jgi:hypothetical protein